MGGLFKKKKKKPKPEADIEDLSEAQRMARLRENLRRGAGSTILTGPGGLATGPRIGTQTNLGGL